MNAHWRCTLLLAICTVGSTAAIGAQPRSATRNVVLVTADGNDKRQNPNVTVFEWLNRKPAYRGKVTAVGSWDLYPFIFNVERSGLYVNAGWVPFDGPSLSKTVEAPAALPLRRIAFGSCANQERPQPIWDAVVATRPELVLLLGDNIYADTLDMNVMRAKYAKLAAMPGFQLLRKSCPILATWDDHDLGANDAGGDYPKKDESQKCFLDFFGDPADSPRRHRPGVYDARVFGPEGKRVQVIMLDTRYFRSKLKRKPGPRNPSDPYEGNPDPTTTILGADQWRWLGEQLRVPAEVRLLVSSIQVVPEDHGFEKWMNFPHERERLFTLIRETGALGVIILSGDRHLAELSMMDSQVGYPIYDLTASGFNQASRSWRAFEANRHRVATMNWGDNFGVVTIDWDQPDPRIALQIRDVDGDITIQQKIRLSTVRPQAGTTR
jgi:alkaline phosphatase D